MCKDCEVEYTKAEMLVGGASLILGKGNVAKSIDEMNVCDCECRWLKRSFERHNEGYEYCTKCKHQVALSDEEDEEDEDEEDEEDDEQDEAEDDNETGRVGGCFIATAAFGTPFAEEVEILRIWRDNKLLSNPLGRIFVSFYYWISPPIARLIANSEHLKKIVRICLTPLIRYLKKEIQ